MTDKIKGGYYIKARRIQQSDIMRMAPCTREVWDWLLCHADHETGIVLTTYAEVQQALAWHVGWRKQMYTPDQIRGAYEALTKAVRIHTRKSTRKTVVTIINYPYYQDPNNYSNPTEKPTRKPARSPRVGPDDKPKEEKDILISTLDDFEKMRRAIRKPLTERGRQLIIKQLQDLYPNNKSAQVACLERSIQNSWQGVFELPGQPNIKADNPGKVRF